ncbi:MAG: Crp/Fnr family transcriptional regulator [Chloroflexota bacterium]
MIHRSLMGLVRGLKGGGQSHSRPASPQVVLSGSERRAHKVLQLSAIDIFRDLSTADLEWLATNTAMVTARRGQLVYTPGETSEALFLLKAGRVQIYRLSPEGKKLVVSSLEPETFFGDMPLAGQQMYGAFAEAVEDCTICVLGRADLERLVKSSPIVGIRLLEVTGQRLVEAEAALESFAFKSVAARLAAVLLRLASHSDGRLTGHSHQDLADVVGAYRETVTQTLDRFRRERLVELGRKEIQLLDREALERIATGLDMGRLAPGRD